jgi:hypothetical protein
MQRNNPLPAATQLSARCNTRSREAKKKMEFLPYPARNHGFVGPSRPLHAHWAVERLGYSSLRNCNAF